MVYLHLLKKEGVLRDHCGDSAFREMRGKKVDNKGQLSGNNSFHTFKKTQTFLLRTLPLQSHIRTQKF